MAAGTRAVELVDSESYTNVKDEDLTQGPVYKIISLNGEPLTVPTQLPGLLSCIDELRSAKLDQDKDILIVAYPKTGTHWTWEMMLMLSRGKAEHDNLSKDIGWCEVTPLQDIYKYYGDIEPRPISMHIPLHHLPNSLRNCCKVVYLIRNPKDALVSNFHHMNAMMERKRSFQEYFRCYLHSKNNWWGTYMDHVAGAWDNFKDDPNTLFLFYEEMKANHRETVVKLAEFMGVRDRIDDKLIDDIVEQTSFKKMKLAKQPSEENWCNAYGQESSLFRKGEVGDWMNYFTDEQSDEFDRIFDAWNKDRQVPFIYN